MGINQYIQIGSRIKDARLSKGIKQNKMAELLGISVSTYSNYENNYREPKLDIIHQICEILGLEIDELLGLSQFEAETVDKISHELLKDDIAEVKKIYLAHFINCLQVRKYLKKIKSCFKHLQNLQHFKLCCPQYQM